MRNRKRDVGQVGLVRSKNSGTQSLYEYGIHALRGAGWGGGPPPPGSVISVGKVRKFSRTVFLYDGAGAEDKIGRKPLWMEGTIPIPNHESGTVCPVVYADGHGSRLAVPEGRQMISGNIEACRGPIFPWSWNSICKTNKKAFFRIKQDRIFLEKCPFDKNGQ